MDFCLPNSLVTAALVLDFTTVLLYGSTLPVTITLVIIVLIVVLLILVVLLFDSDIRSFTYLVIWVTFSFFYFSGFLSGIFVVF